jgi:hypothetical protein
MEDAVAIYQRNLDRVSELLWVRDYEALRGFVTIPNSVETDDGAYPIPRWEDMLEHLRCFRDSLDAMGAEGYHRLCTEARFAGQSDRIEGRHTTYTLRGVTHLVEPHASEMGLRLEGRRWRACWLRVRARNDVVSVIPRRIARPDHDL